MCKKQTNIGCFIDNIKWFTKIVNCNKHVETVEYPYLIGTENKKIQNSQFVNRIKRSILTVNQFIFLEFLKI